MSSSPLKLVTEAEYLNSTYRPDCDFVDGFLVYTDQGTAESNEHVVRHGLIELPIGDLFSRV